MKFEWQNWCRICAKADSNPILSNETGTLANLLVILERHLYRVIDPSDSSISICFECYEFLEKLNTFNEKCLRAEKFYTQIQSIDVFSDDDIEKLRSEYGVDDFNFRKNDKSTNTEEFVIEEKSEILTIEPLKRRGRPRKAQQKVKEENVKYELEVEPVFEEEEEEDEEDNTVDDPSFDVKSDDDENNEDVDFMLEEEIDDGELNESKKSKSKKKNYCSLCHLDFVYYKDYAAHNDEKHSMNEHNQFICTDCSKIFSSLRKLKRHHTVHLPDELKLVHPCQYCDKKFSKRVNVQAHIRAIHVCERPFVCEECGKSFQTKGALKEHQITHSDVSPFQCHYCPKKFKNMPRLRTHEDIHKHTMYVCPHCGLQLNTKRTLKMHLVVHSDLRKYKCQYCGNEYKRSKALKNHLILHSGLRPYTCPFCEKTFSNGSNCRSHKKKAHPVELAALEASGEKLPTANIPKLEQLQPKKPPIEGETSTFNQPTNNFIQNQMFNQV